MSVIIHPKRFLLKQHNQKYHTKLIHHLCIPEIKIYQKQLLYQQELLSPIWSFNILVLWLNCSPIIMYAIPNIIVLSLKFFFSFYSCCIHMCKLKCEDIANINQISLSICLINLFLFISEFIPFNVWLSRPMVPYPLLLELLNSCGFQFSIVIYLKILSIVLFDHINFVKITAINKKLFFSSFF
jgi:hypothetical protein